jgi:hypothetical protein
MNYITLNKKCWITLLLCGLFSISQVFAQTLPIIPSTDTGAGATWYRVRNLRSSEPWVTNRGAYMRSTGYDTRVYQSHLDETAGDEFLWAFIGNNDDGFTIYNRALLEDGARLTWDNTKSNGYQLNVAKSSVSWAYVWKLKVDRAGIYGNMPQEAEYPILHGTEWNDGSIINYGFGGGSEWAYEKYDPLAILLSVIAEAQALYDNTIEGTATFQYTAEVRAIFAQAIADAIAASEETHTFDEWPVYTLTLRQAIITYKHSQNIPQEFIDLISASKTQIEAYKALSGFTSNFGPEINLFQAAINSADNVVENATLPSEIIIATVNLKAAGAAFLEAVYAKTVIPSANTETGAVWYRFKNLRQGVPNDYLYSPGYGSTLYVQALDEADDSQLWSFVGDLVNGFTVYNKAYLEDGARLVFSNGSPKIAKSDITGDDIYDVWKISLSRLNQNPAAYGIYHNGPGNTWLHRNTDNHISAYNFDDSGSHWATPEKVDNLALPLIKAIADAQTFLAGAIVGNEVFQYPTAAKDALSAAIATATSQVGTGTTAAEYEGFVNTLNTALAAFKASKIVPQELIDLIAVYEAKIASDIQDTWFATKFAQAITAFENAISNAKLVIDYGTNATDATDAINYLKAAYATYLAQSIESLPFIASTGDDTIWYRIKNKRSGKYIAPVASNGQLNEVALDLLADGQQFYLAGNYTNGFDFFNKELSEDNAKIIIIDNAPRVGTGAFEYKWVIDFSRENNKVYGIKSSDGDNNHYWNDVSGDHIGFWGYDAGSEFVFEKVDANTFPLIDAIREVQAFYDATQAGTVAFTYPSDARIALAAAIQTAIDGVVEGLDAQVYLDLADALYAALGAYKETINQPVALIELIAECNELVTADKADAEFAAQYAQQITDFETAIAAAEAALASATQAGETDAAYAALLIAKNAYLLATSTGITDLSGDNVIVYSKDASIIVKGAKGAISVINTTGISAKFTAKSSETIIPVKHTGLYIVSVQGKAFKVIVR